MNDLDHVAGTAAFSLRAFPVSTPSSCSCGPFPARSVVSSLNGGNGDLVRENRQVLPHNVPQSDAWRGPVAWLLLVCLRWEVCEGNLAQWHGIVDNSTRNSR